MDMALLDHGYHLPNPLSVRSRAYRARRAYIVDCLFPSGETIGLSYLENTQSL